MNPKEAQDFCPIPFLQLQLNPLGNVSACCYSNEYSVGNIKDSTIESIWNGEKMRSWRREFIDGKPRICANALRSFRCHENYRHLIPEARLTETQDSMPKRLDLRLNGQCNLECVMCDVWRQPNALYEDSDFWKIGPEKIFPFLLEVDMLGGEPFIQKDTYRLIDAVSAVNPKCTWGFITNAQYIFNERLRATLDKIQIRHLHVSLDGIRAETYASIRKKGDLGKSLRTLDAFLDYRSERRRRDGREFVIFASICVQRANWQELPEFLDYCKERRIQPIVQNVIGRPHLELTTLPTEEKRSVESFLKNHLARHSSSIGTVLDHLRSSEQSLASQ